jgi:hypothetical protein
LFGFHFSA